MRKFLLVFTAICLLGLTTDRGRPPVEVEDLADGTDGELYTWDAAGVSAAVATGSAGEVLKSNGVGAAPTFERIAPMVIVIDEKAQNTQGGTCTSTAWRTRDLTTLTRNDDTTGSLSSNQITLPAGTYETWISAPAFNVNQHMIKLRDTTGAADIETGTSALCDVGDLTQTRSFLYSKFALSVSSALEVQHRCVTTQATNGFGIAANLPGIVETYTVAVFRKVE